MDSCTEPDRPMEEMAEVSSNALASSVQGEGGSNWTLVFDIP